MKYLISVLLFVFYTCSIFADNGSFLILKSTYLFQNRSQKGQKNLTRSRKAYNVLNLYASQSDSLMFQIRLNKTKTVINGSGFILETESELKGLGFKEVRVYPDVPNTKSDLTDYMLVPSNQMSFTSKKKASPDFPNISWKAVNYKASMPGKAWVPEWAGIYRPDKDATWLNNTYDDITGLNLDKTLIYKILAGQVEIGFTKEQVRMALGNPIKKQSIENNTKTEWVFRSHKVIFLKNIVNRIL